ncbi:hypothetical protein DL93DRAFT_2140147 [Clavulina sp. PMI_390]|nr:hypothetical protein DL93DRAFT_2140147 [Clavulina sp. PMI_390]
MDETQPSLIQSQALQRTHSDDIYRGPTIHLSDLPPHGRESPSRASSSTTTSSSSASTALVQRALAAVVELAISRWARSGSSSESSSSASSVQVRRRRPQRRSRRGSVSTLAVDPENIARTREAIERARRVPRGFSLIVPELLSGRRSLQALETTSLPLILSTLQASFKVGARLRRDKPESGRHPGPQLPADVETLLSPPSRFPKPEIPTQNNADTRLDLRRRQKQLKTLVRPSFGLSVKPAGGFSLGQRAWWLDVASPTWEDMRTLGTLLHLHPLTLEDIVQQDPREKVELFPRLGYYFIVFRALDRGSGADYSSTQPNLRVTNVYLTVFSEGICSFHFADISDHSNRVRARVLDQDRKAGDMTSDLIAHALMDSIVDAFMPLMDSIEAEVESVDDLVSGTTANIQQSYGLVDADVVTVTDPTWLVDLTAKWTDWPDRDIAFNEKGTISVSEPKREIDHPAVPARRAIPHFRHQILRLLRLIVRILKLQKRRKVSTRMQTLLKLSHTRRMVVVLTRLLGSKSEILGHLRKRFAVGEVAAQLSDVQDHILTMQHSLAYYERVLAHAHPAYLSFLSVSLSQARAGSDRAVLWMSIISIGVVCIQFTIGLFSMNVHIPQNRRPTDPPELPIGHFRWFGAVIAINATVIACFICTVWYWWTQAKKNYARSPLKA